MRLGTKPRLLLLNNATDRSARPAILGQMAGSDFEIEVRWAYGGDLPEGDVGYIGVYLSGSPHGAYEPLPWIEREHRLIEHFARRDIPMFGVCFGSQILASALCGRDQVFRRSSCEVGHMWLDVRTEAADDAVCRDLNTRVRMFIWHNDEVRADHPDMYVVAATDDCPNQIWRHRDVPAWGVQGHLELTRSEAPPWFERNRRRLERDGADVDGLIAEFDEAVEAQSMLKNFLDLCRQDPTGRRRPADVGRPGRAWPRVRAQALDGDE